MARVTIAPDVVRQLHALPNPIKVRLLHMVERLQHWPAVSGAKPLRGDLAGRYRLCTGDYRMQFRVRGDQLVIEKVGHREGFHDE